MSDLAQELSRALDELDRIEREGERPDRSAFILGWLLGSLEDGPVKDRLRERLMEGQHKIPVRVARQTTGEPKAKADRDAEQGAQLSRPGPHSSHQNYSETTMKIEIDNSIPVVEFASAIANAGLRLENDGRGGLRVTKEHDLPRVAMDAVFAALDDTCMFLRPQAGEPR